MTTFRQLKERPAAIYWRRRMLALIIGLSMLAFVAWALAGALRGSAPAASRAATRPHATRPAATLPAAALPAAALTARPKLPAKSPAPGASLAAGVPVASRGPSGHATTRRSASRTARPATSHTRATARPGLRRCAAHDVVLSLFSSQASYTVRQAPEFEIDVVSTAGQTCTFDIGARHVLLRISAGAKRVWTSAACAEGQASLVTKLYRGVPTVVPIVWTGQRSSPGCPVPGPPAPAGSYTALATDGSLASNPLTFRFG